MKTTVLPNLKIQPKNLANSVNRVTGRLAQSLLQLTHNSFALLGLALVFTLLALYTQPQWRKAGEVQLMSWLQGRQEVAVAQEPGQLAIDHAAAAKSLPSHQAAVASWLSKKYSVAPEPLNALVAEAFEIGKKVKLEPTLILAVMAVESGFNPFAQSPVGAQGLMQVMTKIHSDKYASFGGKLAAFDPVANLRVGVKVLQECISRAGGSLEGGLRFYVGAGNQESDGGYVDKVLIEHGRLQAVAGNKPAPVVTTKVALAEIF